MTIKPTERRNSRQHGMVGAVCISYRLTNKVSGSLWCAPLELQHKGLCCFCFLLLTLPDLTKQRQDPGFKAREQNSREKLLLTRSQSYMDYWFNVTKGFKKTQLSETLKNYIWALFL